jgi:aminopeptidase N
VQTPQGCLARSSFVFPGRVNVEVFSLFEAPARIEYLRPELGIPAFLHIFDLLKKSFLMLRRSSYLFALLLLVLSCRIRKTEQSPETYHRVKDPVVPLDTITVSGKAPEQKRYNASAPRINDLIHTRLEVSFNWEKSQLNGKATLTLKPYFYPVDTLVLDAKGMEFKEVSMLVGNEHKKLEYKYDLKQLTIQLGRTYTRDEVYYIYIDYISKPEEIIVKGSAAITSDKGLYFINPLGTDKEKPTEVWTQGETESNSCWFPTIDKPDERMTQEIYITVDKKYVTLSNGLLISSKDNADGTRTDYWKQDVGAAPYLTMMAAGPFAIVKDKWKSKLTGKDMEVNYYVEKDYEPYAKNIFGNTPEMLEFYSNKLGVPYQWEKYSQIVVRDYVSGAMENAGAVIHGEFLQRTDRELLDRDNEDVICHELFHHWFGDLVTCESWANLPLNESFATYGEYLWIEYKYGRDEADLHAQESMFGYLSEASRKQVDLIRYDYEDKEDMFDGHSYNKGGAVLHMLRKVVGDEAFFASLKLYLETNKFRPVEIHNLRLAFEQVTGQDLNWFFNQWFLSPGHPDLVIEHNYVADGSTYSVHIKQVQDFKTTPVFQLPMSIDIYVNGKKERHEVVMTKADQTFTFSVPSRPDLVNVDAEKMLLCTKSEKKSMQEMNFQFKHAPLYLDRFEALTELSKNARDPLASEIILLALKDPHWYIREMAIKALNDMMTDENKPDIKKRLQDLAKNDPKANVRADALESLNANFKGDASLYDTYKLALSDKAYSVVGQGLTGIVQIDPREGLSLAKQLENEKSTSIMLIIAGIYANNGSDENNDFFLRVAPKFRSYAAIGFAGYYTTFLKQHGSDESINKSLEVFENISKNETVKWVRYYGQRSINELIKMYQEREEKLTQKINDLKQTNSDATGLKKLEDDLNQARAQREKLTGIYNDLIK